MRTGNYRNFKINKREFFMNQAIANKSSSVATLRFISCANGSVAVYPKLVEGHSCTAGNPIEQQEENRKIKCFSRMTCL